MKITILLAMCFLISPVVLQAQTRGQQAVRNRIESQRIAFMTQKMDLTPEESASFWPLYNEFRKAHKELRSQIETNQDAVMQMTDDEVDQLLNQVIANDYQQIDMKKSYIEKFKKVIPRRKILMIAPLERAFNREILKKMRD